MTMQTLTRCLILGMLFCSQMVSAAEGEPVRKSGEWEISVTVSGQSTHTAKYCIDSAADDLAGAAGGGIAQSGCQTTRTEFTDQGIAIYAVCKQGNSTVTTTGSLSGDLETAYQGEVIKNYSPPLYGRTEVKSTVEARYIGNCT